MKHFIVAIALMIPFLLISVSQLMAQEKTETPEDCRTAAQAWYDEIDTDTAINTAVTLIEAPSATTAVKEGAFQALDQKRSTLATRNYPSCIEQARQWYLSGIELVEQGYYALEVKRDSITFAVDITVGSQQVGEFRGYMAALGVVLVVGPTNTTLLMK